MFRHRYLLLAFFLAILGTWLTGIYIKKLEQEASGQGLHREVIVAKGSVSKGDRLDNKLVDLKMWPTNLIPQGAVTQIEDIQDKFTSVDLAPGEVIFADRLLEQEEQGLVWRLDGEQRALSIPVSRVEGLESELSPGTKVDILGTIIDYRTGIEHSLMVLENVTLLELVTEVDPYGGSMGKQMVVLAVTPWQAQKLALFDSSGGLQLLLRSVHSTEEGLDGDRALTTRDVLGYDEDNLISRESIPRPEAAGSIIGSSAHIQPSWQVEVIRGTSSFIATDDFPGNWTEQTRGR